MAIGAVCQNMGEKKFVKYVTHFYPFLRNGIANFAESNVCRVAANCAGDVARAIEDDLAPVCEELVTLLIANCQNPEADRDINPPCIAAFADIALAIGPKFEPLAARVMTLLASASAVPNATDDDDDDMFDYVAEHREALLDAYIGIFQGMRDQGMGATAAGSPAVRALTPFISGIGNFLHTAATDPNAEDDVKRKIVELIGDMALAMGGAIKPIAHHPFVAGLITTMRSLAAEDPAMGEAADYATQSVTRYCPQ